MKKILSLMLAAMMLLSMLVFTGCSNEPETQDPETVTIKALNANKELTDITVSYNPERICVLDMAALDIIDSLGLGNRIVGSAKVTIEYLTQYNPDDSNGKIANCGSVKTADMEQVAACAPDVIFIGGRLSKSYAELEKIAPVVYLAVDYSRGDVVMNNKENATAIATMFGKTAEVDAKFDGFQTRIDALTILSVLLAIILFGEINNLAVKLIGTTLIGVGTYLMIEKKITDKETQNAKWIIYAVLSAVFAALTSILAKIGISGVESNLGTAIRTAVVLVMAWIIVFAKGEQKHLKGLDKKELLFIGLSGLATGASWLCYYYAIQNGIVSVVVPIDKMSILVTVLFSFFVFKEKLSRKALLGLGMMIMGTLAMTIWA